LAVNDFGAKNVGRDHVHHLIKCIKEKIWTHRRLDEQFILRDQVALGLQSTHPQHINAGVYQKAPPKYKHKMPKKPQHCPYTPAPKQYGAKAQASLSADISPKLSDEEIKEI
jgi:hypothetical protein